MKTIGISIIVFHFMFFYAQTTVEASTTLYGSTKVSIKINEEAINKFNDDIGRYPTNDEGLYVLIYNHDNIKSWNGPYRNKKFILRDWWHNDYVYINPAKYGNKAFDLYSFGANEKDDFGLKDDITNWSKINYKYYDKYRALKQIFFFFILTIFAALLIFPLYPFIYNLKLWLYCKKIYKNNDLNITNKKQIGQNVTNPVNWLRYIYNESNSENDKILKIKKRIKFGLIISFYLLIASIVNIITLFIML